MTYTFTNFVYQVRATSPNTLELYSGATVLPSGREIGLDGPSTPNQFQYNHTNLILDLRTLDLSSWNYGAGGGGGAYSDTANLTIYGENNYLNGSGLAGYTAPGNGPQGLVRPYEVDKVSLILPEGWSYTSTLVPSAFLNNEPNLIQGISYIGITDPNGKYIWIALNELNLVAGQIAIPPCFTRGSRILCADGVERAVEDLSIGDEVLTKDNGPQPIRWIGSSRLDADTLSAFPNRRPVRLRAGTIGNTRDLSVSPQHRMLVSGDLARAIAPGEDEVLVPAKALLNDHSITIDHEAREVEYFHILFDRHELIRAEGAWSESFLPGRYMMDAMDRDTVSEIVSIFPELEDQPDAYSTPARPLAKPGKARVALKRVGGS